MGNPSLSWLQPPQMGEAGATCEEFGDRKFVAAATPASLCLGRVSTLKVAPNRPTVQNRYSQPQLKSSVHRT